MKTVYKCFSYKNPTLTWKRGQDVRYGVLIFLYTDGTWEEIFQYEWVHIQDKQQTVNTNWVAGRTRDQAIELLKRYVDEGRIKGKFYV